MSWVKRIRHPSDILKKGQEIEVVILKIEPDKERVSVGLRDLTPDPWISEIPEKYTLGDSVTGKVVSIADFGLFLEIEDGVEGLLHVSEVERKPDQKMDELFKVGDELTARVINVKPEERKIDLSLRTMIG
jgi:small subunit ribosomal protein S1